MALVQGHPDVQLLLSTFLRVEQNPGNHLWAIWLDPAKLAGGAESPLPPGQDVDLGDGDYQLFYNGVACNPTDPQDIRMMFQHYDDKQWAVLPKFSSAAKAWALGMWWINRFRPDLVKQCREEAGRAQRWQTVAQERVSTQ